jgi:hypothetical protein
MSVGRRGCRLPKRRARNQQGRRAALRPLFRVISLFLSARNNRPLLLSSHHHHHAKKDTLDPSSHARAPAEKEQPTDRDEPTFRRARKRAPTSSTSTRPHPSVQLQPPR